MEDWIWAHRVAIDISLRAIFVAFALSALWSLASSWKGRWK